MTRSTLDVERLCRGRLVLLACLPQPERWALRVTVPRAGKAGQSPESTGVQGAVCKSHFDRSLFGRAPRNKGVCGPDDGG